MDDVEQRVVTWNDGTGRHVRHWRAAESRDVVLFLHGAESHGGWFMAVAAALRQQGVAAFAYDRQGWGASPGKRGTLADAKVALRELDGALAHLQATYQRVHLAGLSWGGLLAAAARETRPRAFASVTLIVPALYSRRRPGVMAWCAGLTTGRAVPLPLAPEHFTQDPAQQEFVRRDSLRVQAVSASFLLMTLALSWWARWRLHRRPTPPTQLLLASDDDIIDSGRTRRLATGRGLPTQVLTATRHSLVLEQPTTVAAAIAALVRKSGDGQGTGVGHAS